MINCWLAAKLNLPQYTPASCEVLGKRGQNFKTPGLLGNENLIVDISLQDQAFINFFNSDETEPPCCEI